MRKAGTRFCNYFSVTEGRGKELVTPVRLRKIVIPSSAFVLLSLFSGIEALALSPPWYVLQNKLKATLGNDPCIQVNDLVEAQSGGYQYEIDIISCREDQASALASFVSTVHIFGGVGVGVRVLDSEGSLKVPSPFPADWGAVESLIESVLHSNPYYFRIIKRGVGMLPFPNPRSPQLTIEFRAEIVQYPSDNLGDFYRNNNEVAAEAFRDILRLDQINGFQIGVTTRQKSRS